MAKCFYKKKCTADTNPTIPAYISHDGTLLIEDNQYCSKLISDSKKWDRIEVGDNMCNSMTSLELNDYKYLSSINVGSNSFQGLTGLTLSKIPNLSSFSVEVDSFKLVTVLRIESTFYFKGVIIVDIPFTSGTYEETTNAFNSLTMDSYYFTAGRVMIPML